MYIYMYNLQLTSHTTNQPIKFWVVCRCQKQARRQDIQERQSESLIVASWAMVAF